MTSSQPPAPGDAAGTRPAGSSVERVVRPIAAEQHASYIAAGHDASFLQTPGWGRVKTDWRHESLGWFEGERLVGAGLVLYRAIPRTRRLFAYLPEGPAIDWSSAVDGSEPSGLGGWLDPMVEHMRRRRVFLVRMGAPVVTRTWSAGTVKAALADPAVRSLREVPEDVSSSVGASVLGQLTDAGWTPPFDSDGFAGGQPRYCFQLPLTGRTEADVLAGMNQQWRRNIRKADKAGVEVRRGSRSDLATFHRLYVETARRDGFPPRAAGYFQTMVAELSADDPDRIALFLAEHAAVPVAATLMVRVGRHAWYSYGASSTEYREVRGSNAVQWQMIQAAMSAGCHVYDLRGITATLDADDPEAGLIRFKAGTGGQAVEYVGEWDLALNRPLAAAFTAYQRRRAG